MSASPVAVGQYSNLVSEIFTLVKNSWDEAQAPVVLAIIGSRLSQHAKEELSMSGGKLKSFVRLHMRDQLRHFYSSELTDIVAPLPESASLSEDELVERLKLRLKNVNRPSVLPLRFKPEIWKSFTTSLQDEARFVEIKKSGDISVISDASLACDTSSIFEVLKSNLAFDEAGRRLSFTEASQNIKAWAAFNKIDLSCLYDEEFSDKVRQQRNLEKVQQSNIASGHFSFESLLRTLNDSDLSRVMIPADILAKIFRSLGTRG